MAREVITGVLTDRYGNPLPPHSVCTWEQYPEPLRAAIKDVIANGDTNIPHIARNKMNRLRRAERKIAKQRRQA
jgi:hypothetical protein